MCIKVDVTVLCAPNFVKAAERAIAPYILPFDMDILVLFRSIDDLSGAEYFAKKSGPGKRSDRVLLHF